MTTNGEWLEYLANNAPDELAAWFDAERTESPTSDTMRHIGQVIENTIKRGVYGDTEPQDADSREKLEADVFKAAEDMEMFYNGERFIDTRKIFGWLDRQAAITAHQWESYHNGMILEWMAKTEELQAQVDAKDNCIENIMQTLHETQARASNLADDLLTANRQREQYRKLFGMALDWAHEITMLESSIDEGMA